MKRLFAYIFVLAALTACVKENIEDFPDVYQDVESSFDFGYDVKDMSEPDTKSTYISSSFNDAKITGVTVAVYDHSTGVLNQKKHFSSGFSSMEIKLRNGVVYDLYAVANMGDQTSNIPGSKSSFLSDFTYTVPSYSDVDTKGLPMSGRIENFTAGTSTNKTFNMKRLFAKVTLNVTTQFNGGTSNGVKVTRLTVSNANNVLSAFGQSKMESTSNKISSEDYVTNSSVNASSIVFYVPENMQGTIGSATSSRNKNPDTNSAVNAKKDYLTYVDVTVSANSTYYTGTVHYRSYIGTNATTNFDVKGNYKYVWNMTLTEDGLVDDDWKIDKYISDDRYLWFTENPVLVEAGDQVKWSDILETNLNWTDLTHSYGGTFIYSSSPTSTGFTVKSDVAEGTVMIARKYPTHNYSSELDDQTQFRVIERYVRFDRDVYAVNPRKNVDSQVEYGDSYNGSSVGFGGFATGTGVKWTVTPPADLPHTNYSSSKLSYSYNSSTDKVTWTPTQYAPPGDYIITCQTVDGRHSDQAVLRVNDTRWINTDNAYGGYRRETSINKAGISDYSYWNISYAFGDLSCSDDSRQTQDSENYAKYIGSSIFLNWEDYIGYRLVGNASDYLTQYGSVYGFTNRYAISQDIPIGDYTYEIYWKNSWSESLQDYTLKDYAVLHVTGQYITSISIPSTLTVRKGETVNLTASVLPSNASLKQVTWNVLSGSSNASVSSRSSLVADVLGKNVGTATIKAYAADGSGVESNTCTVTVINPPVSLSVTPTSAAIRLGNTQQFTAKVYYYDGTSKTVTTQSNWSSSSTQYATVGVHTGLATADATHYGTTTISASYTEDGVTVSGSAILDVQDYVVSTTTETEEKDETRFLELSNTEADVDYVASLKINNNSALTVDYSSHTVTITKSGSHKHIVYGNVQPQKRHGTRTRDKYTWKSGEVTYGSWRSWSWGAWVNNGDVVTTQKSSTTITDTSNMTITGFTSWFTSSGSVSENTGTQSRSATISTTNGTASASATLTQTGIVIENRYRIVISPDEATIYVGGSNNTQTYTVRKYTDVYTNGVRTTTDTVGEIISNSSVTWSIVSGSHATINQSGVATAVSIGDATVKAVLKSDTSVYDTALLHIDKDFNVNPGTGGSGSGGGNY